MRRLITFVASAGILQNLGQVDHLRRNRRQRPADVMGMPDFGNFADWVRKRGQHGARANQTY